MIVSLLVYEDFCNTLLVFSLLRVEMTLLSYMYVVRPPFKSVFRIGIDDWGMSEILDLIAGNYLVFIFSSVTLDGADIRDCS